MNTSAFAFGGDESRVSPAVEKDIAIIGMAGRYPMADNLDEFWRNLAAGRDCVSPLPAHRWQQAHPQLSSIGDIYGGFLDDIDGFDSLFFNITPRDAAKLDPQERLFLQCAYACIEDAGYTRQTLGRSSYSRTSGQNRVGVFVGAMHHEYQLYGLEASQAGDAVASNGIAASIANRVSFFCDFHGPSLTLDTMCSSSITAIHLACQSLQLQECDVALAGGVNLSLHPNKYRLLKDNRFLSASGRCRSFAQGGDGYVPSEGVGVLILKPLASALLDGDRINGVIKASAVNHGGYSRGYYVPNVEQQSALIRETIDKAGVNARHIQYVEAHGTGTTVGDPIELQGLSAAFGAYTADKQFCAIGSVKSNIGHSESAAGIAALSKILLQMKHGQLAPSLYADQVNPELNFADSPFYLQSALHDWPRNLDQHGHERARMASLSSYGAGGSNAHLIVVEHIASPMAQPLSFTAPLLVLSAPSQAALQAVARQLLGFFQEPQVRTPTFLRDCAYTLQVGREAFAHRLGFIALDVASAINYLQQFLEGVQPLPPQILQGRVKETATQAALIALSGPEQALRAWCEGATVEWTMLYGSARPSRVSLPTYPFSRNKIWLRTDTRQPGVSTVTPLPELACGPMGWAHPLLEHQLSDSPVFSSCFTGQESFLADHQVNGSPTLPAVAYLEMARAAFQYLHAGSGPLSLHKLVWSRPAQAINQALNMRITLNDKGEGHTFTVEAADEAGSYHTCSRGVVDSTTLPAVVAVDVPAFIARHCVAHRSGEECYLHFARIGLNYGPRHRVIETVHTGQDYVVARLNLPQMDAGYTLHPSMADGALQAILGFYLGADPIDWTPVPFGLERADLYRPCSAQMWCIVSRAPKGAGKAFDAQLLNIDGELCVFFSALTIKDFSAPEPSRPVAAIPPQASSGINVSLAIKWLARSAVTRAPQVPGRVLQIGLDDGAEQAWTHLLPQRFCAPHQALDNPDSCQALLDQAGSFDEILWLAPPAGHDPVHAQQAGVCGLFRLVKALLARGAHTRPLSLTVLTYQAQSVLDGEVVQAAHASVHGLIGVLAKEMVQWRLRLVDLDEGRTLPLGEILRLPYEPNAEAWAWRAGQWYRQCLMPCHETLDHGLSVFRRDGVYVIVGGSGGIGKALSRYLIEHYSANIIWLGRRSLALGISQELEQFADLSRVPVYFQADATDEAALKKAHGQIKQRFGHIHGVINSAIVLQDQSVLNLDEQSFDLVLGVKVASSVNVARTFAGEPLDFMLFFSSLGAFFKTAGQSNYAAGSVFQDTFAHYLQRTSSFPVKVMNWGYWGEFGAGASDHYRKRMARMSVASLDSANGMAALEFLLRSSLTHMGFIRVFEFNALNIIPGMLLNQAMDIDAGRSLVSEVEPILERANEQLCSLLPDGTAPNERVDARFALAQTPRIDTVPRAPDVAVPMVGAVMAVRGQALAHMTKLVSQALQVPLEELDGNTPLVRYGVDSISAVYIINALAELFGPVDSTLLFDLQTVEKLTDYFLARHPQVYAAFLNAGAPLQPKVEPGITEPAFVAGTAGLRDKTVQHMRTLVSNALQVPLEELDDSTPLVRYGVDSISAVYITSALSEIFGPVDGSLLFDTQTIDELADHFLSCEALLCAELFGDAVTPPAVVNSATPPARGIEPVCLGLHRPLLSVNRDHDVAVVGMAGRYPGAYDLASFWDNLLNGVHSIEEIPSSRWDWRLGFSLDTEKVGGCYTRWGGFIESHDEFDPVFFHISPAEAELMDPQERLFLEHAYHCIEDAGYTPKTLSLSGDVGVFAGVMNSDYPLASRYWSIANRVSYVLNLKGPSLAVDTACSSSLTALHLALESIGAGSCSSALVGGVNLITDPVHLSSLSYMQMLSHGSACRAFGDQADGFVASEGVGVVLLKPLVQARRDGDHIYGVIKGSMIAAGGLTTGYTVPSSLAQSHVIDKALERAGLESRDVTYIEAHGTGTSLGDPIEVKGLVGAYEGAGKSVPTCALGSVKSNIGHAESAAGMAGLSKILLQMKHGMLAPTLHAQPGNPRIDFAQTRFRLVQTAQPWERQVRQQHGQDWFLPRIAGLSSFGAGGANAHLLIAEDDQPVIGQAITGPGAILLSAQSRDQLRQQVEALLHHVRREGLDDRHLGSLAYTLQTGRETFDWRLGFIANDLSHLTQCLSQLLEHDWAQLSWLSSGHSVPRGKVSLPATVQLAPWPVAVLQVQLEQWAAGEPVDWRTAHAYPPQRLSLPGYPLRRERYWLAPGHDVRRLTPTEASAVSAVSAPIMADAPRSEPPVFTYHEVWETAALPPAVHFYAAVQRVLCLVESVEHCHALAPVIARAHSGCEVLFLVADGETQGLAQCIALPGDDLAAYSQAWREVRQRWSSVDICYHALGACDIYHCERYAGLLFSLQGLLGAGLPVQRLMLVARYQPARLQAQVESWIGFARSLPMVLADTQVSVLACQDNASAGALAFGEWFARHVLPEAAMDDRSVRYLDGQRQVTVIKPLTLEPLPLIRHAGLTWFITGGMGALASLLWRRLHAQGANLVLTGRSPLSGAQTREMEALDRGAGRLLYVQADVNDEVSVLGAVQQAKARFGQINGVIHAAGTAPTTTLEGIDLADFQRVLATKVEGTRVLSRVFEHEALSWHVQFCSSSAVLGDFGSCSYSVANRYQSAFAQALNGSGETAHIVINWPLWRDGAMGLNGHQEERFYLQGSGQDYLETEAGLGLFEQLLSAAVPQAIVLVGANNPLQRLLSGPQVVEKHASAPLTGPTPSPSPLEQAGQLRAVVLEAIEGQLKLPAERIRTTLNWNELGFDSIKLAQLGKQLSGRLGVNLTPATFFGNPSAEDLIGFLSGQALSLAAIPVPVPVRPAMAPEAFEPIAIIGVSARVPGAESVEQLWSNWQQGVSSISAASACLGPRAQSAGFAGHTQLYGAFLDEVEAFDPLFFELSPHEAAAIDPQQRLFLQAAWHAFEDAGYLGASIRGSQCGVFVGAEESLYGDQLEQVGRINANRNATLSARIAYALDLSGPNYSLTASCSSGLVAIHQACRALHNRDCSLALAGGISLMVSPRELGALAEAMPLAQEAACRVFDQDAGGLVPAEAVAAVVLKPLSQALVDGDQVYGVIRSSALNYDGRTNGILAPNPMRQAELFAETLNRGGLAASQVQLVMAHSMGMHLGDPVEVEALQKVFTANRSTTCALSSVKPLLGHSFAASGVVDLLALLMALRHRRLPALHGYRQANEYITFDPAGLSPVRVEQPWSVAEGELRRGLISTTGINGSNACMIIEEAPGQEQALAAAEGTAHLVVLSAPDAPRLAQLAERLLQHLETALSLRIEDIAMTLLHGRQALECRAAWVVGSLAALRLALADFSHASLGYRGANPVLEPQAALTWPAMADPRALHDLAAHWVKGAVLPADVPVRGRRISLPLTTFLRTPCWLAVSRSVAPTPPVQTPAVDADGEVQVFLLAFLEQHLGLGRELILLDKPLRQYGMDSVLAMKLGHALEQHFQIRLSARAFHENPSLAALDAHIRQQPRQRNASAATADFQDVGVIAMLDQIVNREKSFDDVKELLK